SAGWYVPVMNTHLRSALRACWAPLAERIARAYVADPTLADALAACRRLSAGGFASTVGFWDAADDGPGDVPAAYLRALGALGAAGVDGHISIKAPAVGFSRELIGD